MFIKKNLKKCSYCFNPGVSKLKLFSSFSVEPRGFERKLDDRD